MTKYTHFDVARRVCVAVTEPSVVSNRKKVEVNWSALGDVTPAMAAEFASDLQRAVDFARSEEARLGLPSYGLLSKPEPDIYEMALCEAEGVVLKPNQLYRFTVVPDCLKLAEASDPKLKL